MKNLLIRLFTKAMLCFLIVTLGNSCEKYHYNPDPVSNGDQGGIMYSLTNDEQLFIDELKSNIDEIISEEVTKSTPWSSYNDFDNMGETFYNAKESVAQDWSIISDPSVSSPIAQQHYDVTTYDTIEKYFYHFHWYFEENSEESFLPDIQTLISQHNMMKDWSSDDFLNSAESHVSDLELEIGNMLLEYTSNMEDAEVAFAIIEQVEKAISQSPLFTTEEKEANLKGLAIAKFKIHYYDDPPATLMGAWTNCSGFVGGILGMGLGVATGPAGGVIVLISTIYAWGQMASAAGKCENWLFGRNLD